MHEAESPEAPKGEGSPLAPEAPKRGRGRPPGAKSTPPAETEAPGVVRVKEVKVHHGIWIGKGNYSGFKTDIEMTADVPAGMTVDAAREVVSQNARAALEKELKVWADAEQRAAEIKKVAP